QLHRRDLSYGYYLGYRLLCFPVTKPGVNLVHGWIPSRIPQWVQNKHEVASTWSHKQAEASEKDAASQIPASQAAVLEHDNFIALHSGEEFQPNTVFTVYTSLDVKDSLGPVFGRKGSAIPF
ncbi:unnamed protein product, partial [Amoebophrya sp. A120]